MGVLLDDETGQFRVGIELARLGMDDVLDAGKEWQRVVDTGEEARVDHHETPEQVFTEGQQKDA